MAKLTESELNAMQQAQAPPREPTDKEKTDMVARVHSWQESENIHAWDEESLVEDLGISIQGFTLTGTNKDGIPIEVEFRRPLDEKDVKFQGVAFGFRLIRVQGDFYTLQSEPEDNPSEAQEEESE